MARAGVNKTVAPEVNGIGLLHHLRWLLLSILLHRAKYSTFEPEGILANVLGLLLACFGVAVLYILAQADWKRPPQAEEQALSMDFKTLTEGDSPSSQ